MASNGMKFPPFWEVDPEIWLLQVEAFFSLSKITDDEEKFQYLVVNANRFVLPFITDLIKNPPTLNKYQTIKHRIRQVFVKHGKVKMDDLIGEVKHFKIATKPSQLLLAMLSYNYNEELFTDYELKSKFLGELDYAPCDARIDFNQLIEQCNQMPNCRMKRPSENRKEVMSSDVGRIMQRVNQLF